jgi:hypothetical protein
MLALRAGHDHPRSDATTLASAFTACLFGNYCCVAQPSVSPVVVLRPDAISDCTVAATRYNGKEPSQTGHERQ